MVVEPQTVPLNFLGVVDVAASNVQENDLLSQALANVSQADKSLGWAVKHSGDCVNEYPRIDADGSRCHGSTENPNHLLGSFPCLFPYGLGGFEVDRPISISYDAHARWALRYEDKRFRKDYHFMFQVFGVYKRDKSAPPQLFKYLNRPSSDMNAKSDHFVLLTSKSQVLKKRHIKLSQIHPCDRFGKTSLLSVRKSWELMNPE